MFEVEKDSSLYEACINKLESLMETGEELFESYLELSDEEFDNCQRKERTIKIFVDGVGEIIPCYKEHLANSNIKYKIQLKDLENDFTRINEMYNGKLTKENIRDIYSFFKKALEIYINMTGVIEESRLNQIRLNIFIKDENIGYF